MFVMLVVSVKQDLYLKEKEIIKYFLIKINILLLVVPGSIFGLVVTSCDDDFLGIRNNDVTEVGGANGLLFVPVDGLVSFAASIGGDVTFCLFVFAPDGIERARCFNASLSEVGILFDVGGTNVAVAVPVGVVAADDEDCSCPG